MKITAGDLKKTRTTREVDIGPFVSSELLKKAGGKIIIELRSMTMKEYDDAMGTLVQYAEYDSDAERSRFTDKGWVNIGRVESLLLQVNTKRADFPFEKWDRETIEEFDEECPDLINFLSDEIEDLNRPLAKKMKKRSDKASK